MMFLEKIAAAAAEFMDGAVNYVAAEDALRPDLAGMRIYDEPLFGAAAADDPAFAELCRAEVLHPEAMLPYDWLPGARSVISFFLPFTETVRSTNRAERAQPSEEWLHARIEGQMAIAALGEYLKGFLEREGAAAVFPTTDARFKMLAPYASNWSERHAAYICGLGTFGLSKGLITERGIAGRFGSLITDAEIPATPRKYESPYEYCTMCGACQRLCPAEAIDAARGVALGKDHDICGAFVKASTRPPHGPHARVRYGCGKCQVGVPCEKGIPRPR